MGKIPRYEEAKKLLKDWWRSDLDIEIETRKDGKNVLIFSPEDSYWWDGEWIFKGTRTLLPPDDEYRTKQWYKKMEPYFYEKFTLDEALEFLKDYNDGYII